MDTPLSISSDELKDIQENEACIIQEFTFGGSRIGRLASVGTREEMEEEVKHRTILALPIGTIFECQAVHNCADLLS